MRSRELGVIWMAVLCHGTAGAQWLDLDGFMQEQIVTGWWSPQERFLVLQHLDAHGAPHVKEEAWSIEGLSNPSAAQLMASSQWLKLVAESKHSASNGSGGLRAEIRGGWKDEWSHSIRIRNGGKWGIRRESGDGNDQLNEWSGFLTGPPKPHGWKFLIGGHRLGWGNRLNVEEESLFAGLDDPVFAIPVTYAFAPAWGRTEWIPRNGLAVAHQSARQEHILSVSERGRDCALLVHSTTSGWGWVTRWREDTGVGLGGFWNWKHGWTQGILEASWGAEGWAMNTSWQTTPSRFMERHVRAVFRVNREAELTEVQVVTGGQWMDDMSRWRVRWRGEWSPVSHHSPLVFQVRRTLRRDAFWEVRWKSSQTSFEASNTPLRRLEIRFRTAWERVRSDVRIAPFARIDAFGGWAYTIKYQADRAMLALSVAAWDMPLTGISYYPDLALNGVIYRPMSGLGNRVTASLRFRPTPAVKIHLLATKSSAPSAVLRGSDMLTLGYAQTGVHVSVQLQL